VLYLDKSLNLKKKILEARSPVGPIQIYETSLTDVPMWSYRDQIKTIQDTPRTVKYPKDISNILPEYCVIQYSKFGWLETTVTKNVFGSPMFAWIDAGLSRFYDTQKVYSFGKPVVDKFFIQADSTKRLIPDLTPDNYIGTSERILAGGMWVTSPGALKEVNTEVMRIWKDEMMAKNRLDNEQIALALVSQSLPSIEFVDTIPSIPFSIFTEFFI
jgi:hypothetical protein